MFLKYTKAQWATLLSCSLSTFVVWLDVSIVNTAMPAIENALSTSVLQLQWIMNSFNFAVSVLIVTLGRLSDRRGRKKMNILGVFLFGLASLFAGAATSAEWLIICRFLQGISSAAIIPSALGLITEAFSPQERGKAIGFWTAIGGVGLAAGPAVGGFLVSLLNWRWIFYMNVPFAVLSIILSWLLVKESKKEGGVEPIDYKGVTLLVLGLGSLVYSFMHGPDWGWAHYKTLFFGFFALLLLTWFFFLERSSPYPLIPFPLLLKKEFLCPLLVVINLVFVFTSSIFLIPLYLIQIQGYEAFQAGLMILSMTVCISLFSLFSGHFMWKIGPKRLILMGLSFFLVGTFMQTFFHVGTSSFQILIALIFLGVGWGMARAPATTSAISSIHHARSGVVTGVLWTLQNAGGTLGIAIVLTVFRKIFEKEKSAESFMQGYDASMWILSTLCLITVLIIAKFMKSPVVNNK